MSKKQKERVFSAHEVANICGVVNQTTINWIEKGHLEAFRTPGGQYRVYPDVLAKFLKDQRMRLPQELQDILAEQTKIDRILIVDGDAKLSERLLASLNQRFPDTATNWADDGFEAGRAIADGPDLILIDLELPGIDGFKLCRRIKNDESLMHPIVIATTSGEEETIRERATEAGADAVLGKPVIEGELFELIDRLAEERAARRT